MKPAKLDEATLPFAGIPELGAALRSHEISSSELTKYLASDWKRSAHSTTRLRARWQSGVLRERKTRTSI